MIFHVKEFGNMSDPDCSYGGVKMSYQFPFHVHVSEKRYSIYLHDLTRIFTKRPRKRTVHSGPYCTRGEGFPLVGTLNNIYLNKGKTDIALYALPPYFYIDLVVEVVLTPCEGITNPIGLLCRSPILTVVTPTYHIRCTYTEAATRMFVRKNKCVVLQQAPPVIVQRTQLDILSTFGMSTVFSFVTNRNTVTGVKNPCVETVSASYRSINGSISIASPHAGMQAGHGLHRGPVYVSNVSEAIIRSFGSCNSLPLLYYQFQIFNNNTNSMCFESSIVRPVELRAADFNEYDVSVPGLCAFVNVVGYKGFYSLNINSESIQIIPDKVARYFFVVMDKSCLNRFPIRVYLTKIYKFDSRLNHYLLPANNEKLLFEDFTEWDQVHIDITEDTSCKLQLLVNIQFHNEPRKIGSEKKYTSHVLQVGLWNIMFHTIESNLNKQIP